MHCHKILIVEDDESIRTTLIELLALEGYAAVPAHHGKEALELMKSRTEDPCLIITDFMMPEMDGMSLIRYLKQQDTVISIPIILMTASEGSDLSEARKVIRKPFELDSIVALVKEYCGEPDSVPIGKSQMFL